MLLLQLVMTLVAVFALKLTSALWAVGITFVSMIVLLLWTHSVQEQGRRMDTNKINGYIILATSVAVAGLLFPFICEGLPRWSWAFRISGVFIALDCICAAILFMLVVLYDAKDTERDRPSVTAATVISALVEAGIIALVGNLDFAALS